MSEHPIDPDQELRDIIARDREAKQTQDAEVAKRQEQECERQRIRQAIDAMRCSTGDEDWLNRLERLLNTPEDAGIADAMDRLPEPAGDEGGGPTAEERKNARRITRHCVNLLRAGKREQALERLKSIVGLGRLDYALAWERCEGLPNDLCRLLDFPLPQPAPANPPGDPSADTEEEGAVSRQESPSQTPPLAVQLSLRRVGEMWDLRYLNDQRHFPVKGNLFIRWLAKLLAHPNQGFTVAQLRGDPEGKLAADAALGGEDAMDAREVREIRERIEEINDSLNVGSSERLEDEKAQLIRQLEPFQERLQSGVKKGYDNIARQKRDFLNEQICDMPSLAAHLKLYLMQDPESYSFAYRPPSNAPRWHIEI
jgi:hypothetical protein